MSDTIKVTVYVSTNKAGSKCEQVVEFAREDWDEMDGKDRDDALVDTMLEMVNWDWYVED